MKPFTRKVLKLALDVILLCSDYKIYRSERCIYLLDLLGQSVS